MLGTVLSFSGTASAARAQADATVTPATSITMWTGDGPDQAWQQALMPEFTKATGISVTYDAIPEDVLQNKVTAAQEVKSTSFAMYEEPESLTPCLQRAECHLPDSFVLDQPDADTCVVRPGRDTEGIHAPVHIERGPVLPPANRRPGPRDVLQHRDVQEGRPHPAADLAPGASGR